MVVYKCYNGKYFCPCFGFFNCSNCVHAFKYSSSSDYDDDFEDDDPLSDIVV